MKNNLTTTQKTKVVLAKGNMFEKIRSLLNKETRVSRITEFFKWVMILLLFDALFAIVFIILVKQLNGENNFLNPIVFMTIFILFVGHIVFWFTRKEIYSYLYTTHPCTIKLNNELLEREERSRQQLEESKKKLEEEARVKAIEVRAKKEN